MPYGSQPFKTRSASYYVNGETRILSDIAHGLSWSRGGTNRNSGYRSPDNPSGAGSRVIVVTEVDYSGPRLPYKIRSPKTGKLIWARQPIVTYRLKTVRSNRKGSKDPGRLPNDLDFIQRIRTDPPRQSLTVFEGLNTPRPYANSISGDLVAGGWRFRDNEPPFLDPYRAGYFNIDPFQQWKDDINRTEQLALGKLYDRVKNQKINVGQALLESRQTASLIADSAKKIAASIALIRKGRLADAAKKLFPRDSKELANEYLQYQYGIKPLLSDIVGAAQTLAAGIPSYSYDVKAKESYSIPRELVNKTVSSWYGGTVTDELYLSATIDVVYKARVKVKSFNDRTLALTGIHNTASLNWETIPYSFVVDWLIPVGDYLSRQDSFLGLEVEWVTRTYFIRMKTEFFRSIQGGSTENGYGVAGGFTKVPIVEEKIICSRKSLNTDIPPPPALSLRDPISSQHVLNAAALIRQLFKR